VLRRQKCHLLFSEYMDMEAICSVIILVKKDTKMSPVPVAHACNPSYSGGRDQEDHGSKPARGNSS
jgi:hypothetical protein